MGNKKERRLGRAYLLDGVELTVMSALEGRASLKDAREKVDGARGPVGSPGSPARNWLDALAARLNRYERAPAWPRVSCPVKESYGYQVGSSSHDL